MITSELLYKYRNGNGVIKIFEDGTKEREFPDNEFYKPEYPENIDVKITDYCDAGCAFCHEMSTVDGLHGKLLELKEVFEKLPRGTELAIGGGNPLSHPNLKEFLVWCRSKGLICNLTINHFHLERYKELIFELRRKQLIKGIGISFNRALKYRIPVERFINENTVIHLIAGVHSIEDYIYLNTFRKPVKVLILGYKSFGRGLRYKEIMDSRILKLQDEWNWHLPEYLGKKVISFDNLAIRQLDVKRFFTERGWESFYMGDDGKVSMYMDLVKKQYSVCSFSEERFNIEEGKDIKEMFRNINSS